MTPSTAAAGIMIQIARGGFSSRTTSASEAAGHHPVGTQHFRFSGRAGVADALVPGLEPAARHVAAHPAETDETELHGTLRW